MPPQSAAPRWHFVAALSFTAVFSVVVLALLTSDLRLEVRQGVSSAGLVLSALVACSFAVRAAVRSAGERRRCWLLLTAAGLIAATGNVWNAVASGPGDSVGNGAFLVAQVVAIVAMLSFPAMRPRGREAVIMALDGLIIGLAAMAMATALVYWRILGDDPGGIGAQVAALAYPVMDVVLVTVSFTVISRSRDESVVLLLVGTGFLGFALADLAFLTLDAGGQRFVFGGPIDLGWMVSYLLIGAAALHPRATESGRPPGQVVRRSDVRYTVVTFAVIGAALVVEISFGGEALDLTTTAVLWLLLLAAAATRQVVLTYDNAKLREGLEERVTQQTGDLRRLARRTEVLVASVGDGIYGVDETGRVTFVNPSAAGMLGTAPELLLGRRAHQEFHASAEDATRHRWQDCYVTEAIERGLVSSVEDLYLRADGSAFPVEVTSSPIVEDEVTTGAVVAFRDITQRREVERIKDELLSVVSHELRTPLTSIRGSLGLLSGGAAGPLTPTAQRMATVALRSSERLTRLLNDILDVERLESGAFPMRVAPQDAEQLLTTAAAVLADHARGAGIEIRVGRAGGRVLADPDRITQTLVNLLSNAVKFSPAGSAVELEATPMDGEVLFRVRDAGRGIPQDRLERIFERFEQVDSSDARLEGGTGLGLAISRGIIERHGGRIWAESAVGAGTTMLFTLPSAHLGEETVSA